jgi:hypothetical protein
MRISKNLNVIQYSYEPFWYRVLVWADEVPTEYFSDVKTFPPFATNRPQTLRRIYGTIFCQSFDID